MYEPSKHCATFHIAGFQHYDGALALAELKAGHTLSLVPEFDNPHDPNAIALYHGNLKLGFIPRFENELMAQLMYYGHTNVFQCRILQVDEKADPWEQVRVGIYVTDNRNRA